MLLANGLVGHGSDGIDWLEEEYPKLRPTFKLQVLKKVLSLPVNSDIRPQHFPDFSEVSDSNSENHILHLGEAGPSEKTTPWASKDNQGYWISLYRKCRLG